MRAAVYYAPPADDPLWPAACRWLGRDAQTGDTLPQPDLPDIGAITADPRGYGFHATLKPPMRLAGAWDDFLQAAAALAARQAPFRLPPLAVADLHGFLALRETEACPALHALSDACVTGLDAFRVPPDKAELARRRRGGLSPAADANLLRWGYPYVLDTWRFHMTLTRRLSEAEKAVYLPAAHAHFAGLAERSRRIGELCVFQQPEAGAPFTIAARLPLRG
jgi:putative phosphonate metabolism protein